MQWSLLQVKNVIEKFERKYSDGFWWVGGILNAGIDFLEFKPSEIAAAVAISVAVENKTVDTEKAISALAQHVQKVKTQKSWWSKFQTQKAP